MKYLYLWIICLTACGLSNSNNNTNTDSANELVILDYLKLLLQEEGIQQIDATSYQVNSLIEQGKILNLKCVDLSPTQAQFEYVSTTATDGNNPYGWGGWNAPVVHLDLELVALEEKEAVLVAYKTTDINTRLDSVKGMALKEIYGECRYYQVVIFWFDKYKALTRSYTLQPQELVKPLSKVC